MPNSTMVRDTMSGEPRINLSVNLNKVALLRNSRGASNPAPLRAAEAAIDAGVQGLTLHWRQDERHTRQADVRNLCALARERGVEGLLTGEGQRGQLDQLFHLQGPVA